MAKSEGRLCLVVMDGFWCNESITKMAPTKTMRPRTGFCGLVEVKAPQTQRQVLDAFEASDIEMKY